MRRLVLALGVVAALSACAGGSDAAAPSTTADLATTAITRGWDKMSASSREQLCALIRLDPEMFWGMWQATMGVKFPSLDRHEVDAFMDGRCER